MIVPPPCVVKPAAVEISAVISFEPGTIVLEVDPVTIVAIPGRVVIINIAGVFGFANIRGSIVATIAGGLVVGRIRLVIDRGRLLIYGSRSGVNRSRCNIHPRTGDTKADVRVYIYL
jgi:hypothetical protein